MMDGRGENRERVLERGGTLGRKELFVVFLYVIDKIWILKFTKL